MKKSTARQVLALVVALTIVTSPIAGTVGASTPTSTASPQLLEPTTDAPQLNAAAVSPGDVLYRVNAGGSVSVSSGPDWEDDAPYLVTSGSQTASNPAPDTLHSSVPSGTQAGIWTNERYDPPGGDEMQYEFDVASGETVHVRLYVYDGYSETSNVGDRVFDVSVEGQTAENFDIIEQYGDQTAAMKSFTVTSDGTIDIDFAHVTENPLVNAIEIVSAGSQADTLGSPSSVDFGTVVTGNSTTESVTLTNRGNSSNATHPDITVSSVDLDGTNPDEFSHNFSGSVTLAPGESTTVNVTYSPSNAQPHAGSLEVTHSGSNSPVTVDLTGEGASTTPVGFSVSGLDGASLGNPTSLDFGPDGRLYVAQQSGEIKAFEIVRSGPNDYEVTDTEVISAVQDIPNHDDDGSYNSNVDNRQVTGLTVEGTASTPVVYVTSSDPRIGAGGSHTDSGLDTNSGVVSRLTQQSDGSWEHDMLVRGLPRSEENHATNGIQYDPGKNVLYVAQGGHTNKGAPSDNFALTPEYALSAAILEINLTQINQMSEKDAANTEASYLYDLPTLQGTDKPFGGQNGANMAKWTTDSPVDVYAPGFRNAYDVALNSDGQLYATDNSANPGWGGVVVNEGPQGECTNAQNEQDEYSIAGVYHIDGEDYYGGHPNPTRGNATSEFAGAVESGLHDPVNCDYISPTNTSTESAALETYGPTPQGMDVYTASNFGGAMKGDLLLAMWNSGDVERVELNAAGTAATSSEAIFENIGNNPLDVHAQGDDGKFPGTVWAATYGNNDITVFEPNDYGGGGGDGQTCTTADPDSPDYDPGGDADNDGYTNADENAVGTDPCSQASQPEDYDQDDSPDSIDSDDDNDGLTDGEDPFAIDPQNGLDNELPVDRQFVAGQHPQSLFGLGFTGLMTNGTNYAALYNASEVRAGGATERISVDEVPFGDAYQNKNSQTYAFQYGVNATGNAPFTVVTTVESPFSDDMTPENYQSAGMQIGPGNQDNYFKLVASAQDASGNPNGGVEFVKEVDGTAESVKLSESDVFGSGQTIDLYLDVYPSNDTVVASYAIDGSNRTYFGTTYAMPESWYANDTRGLAVGLISTANGASSTFSASWDQLTVTQIGANTAPTADAGSDRTVDEGTTVTLDASGSSDADGDTLGYSWTQTSGSDVQLSAQDDAEPSFTAPDVNGDTTLTFEVEVTDSNGANDTDTVSVTVQDTDAPPADGTLTVAEAVAMGGDDDTLIENAEIQQAINWWSTDSEVPDTGGETIGDQQIQTLINLWATNASVGDGTGGGQASIDITSTSVDGNNVTVSWNGTAAASSDHVHVQLDDNDYTGGQPINGSYTFADVAAGEHTVSVTVADTGHNEYQNAEATDSATVTVSADSGDGELVAAINAGGGQYTASDGTEYVADTYFDGGSTTTAGNAGIPSDLAINGTEDDTLYQSERYGDPFGYDIPVAENGTYEITLQFAEIYQGVSSNDSPDSSGPSDGTNENDRLFNASIGGEQVLSEYDLFAAVGPATATEKTYTVEVTDGTLNVDFSAVTDNAKVSAITVRKVDDAGASPTDGEATMQVDAGENNIDATTWDSESFSITNTGDGNLETITLDLRTAVLPDVVFDPDGTAGDQGAKGFVPNSGADTVGLVEGSVSMPHNGVDGADGYDKLTIEFDDFQPGETFTFEMDNDPTSIKGGSTVQSGEAGPISGLELAGSTMTATFADGATAETSLFSDGSLGGSQGIADATTAPAPTIGVDDVSLTDTTLSPNHSATTVSSADQTITVEGEPGATVTVLRIEGELNLDGVPTYDGTPGYDVQAYEANTALQVEEYTATVGSDGTVDVPVTLTNSSADGGLNYFIAAAEDADGELGATSNVVVLEYDEDAGETGGEVVAAINAGGGQYTASDGTVYEADAANQYYSSGSATASTGLGIDGTEDDPLYQSERYGSGAPFSYDIPVAENGTYEVTLHLAETWHTSQTGGSGDDAGAAGEVGDRVMSANLEGGDVELDGYDIYADVGGLTATQKTYTVEVTDGTLNVDFTFTADNAKVSAIAVTKVEGSSGDGSDTGTGSATFAVNANGGIDASTYNGGSFEITNTGEKQISSVTYDLGSAVFPDVVFDPQGTAGDTGAKGFTPDSGVSAVAPSGSFSAPHNGVDGADGYDELTIDFGDFQSGETFAFSTDIDPTSIKGGGSSGAAGSVSGLELSAATVTVEYADGTTQTTQLMGDGSDGGSQATASANDPTAPTLGVQDVSLDSSALDAEHSAATVTNAQQTVTVSGPAGATVQLLHVEGQLELFDASGYELEAYEANTAKNVAYHTVTLDSNGQATVDVTLTNTSSSGVEGGYNYFVGTVENSSSDTSRTSNVVVLEYDESSDGGGSSSAQVLHRVNAGEGTTINATGDGPDWTGVADTNSQYLASVSGSTIGNSCTGDSFTVLDSVPESTPDAVFQCERYGPSTWEFSVDSNQEVDVRLYLGNRYAEADQSGDRQFNVSIEGQQVLTQYDPVADVGHGNMTMKSFTVTDDGDGTITIAFEQGSIEQPTIRAIEIVESSDSSQ